MGHFIVSMLLVLDAVVLHHRARRPDHPMPDGPARGPVAPAPVAPIVPRPIITMGRLLVVTAALVLFLGTIVTASGPHPGSNGSQVVRRLAFSLHAVARLHGVAVMLFLAMTLATIWAMVRSGAPAAALRRAEVLLAVLVAQAAVGYVQYFTGVPALLVGVHIAGATAVWIATLRFHLGLTDVMPAPVPAFEPAAAVVGSSATPAVAPG
jgi:cytochrome c oxidase assembly protein subunit 15